MKRKLLSLKSFALMLSFGAILMFNQFLSQCEISVNVFSASWGDGTTWTLTDAVGTTVLNGGTYGNGYNDTQTLPAAVAGNYTFSVTSSFGDNSPNYSITLDGVVVFSGNAPGAQTTTVGPIVCAPFACAGVPNLGNTTGPANICPNINFTLNFSESLPGSGVTYVWETSTDGVAFNAAVGAPNMPSWTTSITEDTWFRVTATCNEPGGGTSSSTPVQVMVNSFIDCYCTAGVGPTSNTFGNLQNVTLFNGVEFLDNDSPCPAALGLLNFDTIPALDLAQGEEYDLNFVVGQCGVTSAWNNTIKAWIDYDQTGSFDAPAEELGFVTLLAPAAGIDGSFAFQVPATATLGETRLRVMTIETTNPAMVQPCASFIWGSVHDYIVNITPAPTCPKPSNLAADNVSNEAAIISWTAAIGQDSWELEYGVAGFDLGSGTSVITGDNPYSLTGLMDNTSYDVYVRSICAAGDTSFWRGPVSFTTLCNIFVAPFIENFDGSTWVSGTGFNNIGAQIDDCWANNPSIHTSFFWGSRLGNTSNNTTTGPAGDKSGSGKYVYTEASTGLNGSVATFDSPAISLSEILDPYLGFSYFMRGANCDSLNVLVSNDFGTTWNDLMSIYGQQQTLITDSWLDTIVSLAGYDNDTIMIRFRHIKSGFNADIAIDEFFVLPCLGNPGTGTATNVCIEDGTIELASLATITQVDGEWLFPGNQQYVQNNSVFQYSLLPTGTYDVYYKVPGACADDSLTVTISVFPPSAAGITDQLTVCPTDHPFNLFDGITGNLDLGGTWFAPDGTALNSAIVEPFGMLAGNYNYYYTSNNGVCPNDTSFAEVTVLNILVCAASLTENEIAGFELYPNPTVNTVYLSYKGDILNAQLILMDSKGALLRNDNTTFETGSVTEISLEAYPAGVYFVTIMTDTGRNIIQVVKQ